MRFAIHNPSLRRSVFGAALAGLAGLLAQNLDYFGPGHQAELFRLRGRLAGGAFRWLNESLYTTDGDGAWGLMAGAPDLFEQYHQA